ncbi:FliO/MopB family protein [bacterium]|nr:FliO/MopB family protein [bacterium]
MGYLTNFIVYTLAMIGVIMIALFIFKFSSTGKTKSNSKFLKIDETLSLGPRKTLYVVSAGDEKFLIAGDIDKTSLISKLNNKNEFSNNETPLDNFRNTLEKTAIKTSYMDKNNIGIYKTQNKPYDQVMKNLAERIRQ